MNPYKSAYYEHVSTCKGCLPDIEHGRINSKCIAGWDIFKTSLFAMDEPYQGRAYPSQAWLDNMRKEYVEWVADNAKCICAEINSRNCPEHQNSSGEVKS